jgi:hypothetical protein
MLKSKKFWRRFIIGIVIIPVLLFTATIAVLYWKQKEVVQELVKTLNEDFVGEITLSHSDISPFESFPYVSIDLHNVKVYENKQTHIHPILNIEYVFLGFSITDLLSGKVVIKSLKLKNGHIDIIQYKNSEFNITNALASKKVKEESSEETHLNLKEIYLEDVDVTKLNEANALKVETYISKGHASFKTSPEHVFVSYDSKFVMNLIKNGDTTFVKHKHFEVDTKLDYYTNTDVLHISPSDIILEHAAFKMDGSVDFRNDVAVDMNFSGEKSNFDLFIAFAPEEMAPLLARYDNQGKIYFKAKVKGKTANGNQPAIDAEFGCKETYFLNSGSKKKLEEIKFEGYFTNGTKRNLSTMEFGLKNMYAKPEAGVFTGNVVVRNFETPQIEMRVRSEFNLQYLAKFLNLEELQNLDGNVALTVNFDELVDVNLPETSLNKIKTGSQSELKVTNLSFKIPGYHLPIRNFNLLATMTGDKVNVDYCNVKLGKSDLSVSGSLNDLPAILNHTNKEVFTNLVIKSSLLDIKELTSFDTAKTKPVDERISNFNMKLAFKTSAKAVTESKHLPTGEFFIEDLYAKLNHYPHTFHDFHADFFIDENDFRLQDFSGLVDKSDFHFSGRLDNYQLWFEEHSKGDTKIEYNLTSNLLKLEDLFSYKGENYMPEDYRHEELGELKVHGITDLHFNEGLKSIDTYLDKLDVKMKAHHLKLDHFNGRVHYENEHLLVQKFSGKMGKSDFLIDLAYYLGKDKAIKKRDNHFYIKSSYLDFDQLSNYNPPPVKPNQPVDHEGKFSIYDLPFTDMRFDLDIAHLNYHRYLLNDLKGKLRTQEHHYIYIDTLVMNAAGGHFDIKGYFNGSDRNKIYFSPNIKFTRVDLDKLMFKFENFGQDHLVSENLHGEISGVITGKVHMHNDLVPIIDDSEIHFDFNCENGKLTHFAPMDAMSSYFKDKDLTQIRFDTLQNKIDLKNGVLTIPAMTINSTLGFMQVSGKQDLNANMEYYVRVPWKMVTGVGYTKLFGKKKEDNNEPDEIIFEDKTKKTRYINLKVTGNSDNFKISLGKDKSAKGG